MTAVWRAARAAVARRRLQTLVIALVVLCSTTTLTLALGLLSAASAPFDKAFDAQHGAQLVAVYDRTAVTDGQLTEAAHHPGVEAAGPYGEAVATVTEAIPGLATGPLRVVGRAAPDGPVDRVELLGGRWAAGPGEIVLDRPFGGELWPGEVGAKVRIAGSEPLTVVGVAVSMSRSAQAWVTPEQLAALHPAGVEMLYRFDGPGGKFDGNADALRAGQQQVTAGLPAGALTSTQSYLELKAAFSATAEDYLPFMGLFGVLGVLVAVLIVGNVVSGAVVSGFRHIGVLKALGFTPNQVVAVYLTMVSLPALAGCILGTVGGAFAAGPVLKVAFQGVMTGSAVVEVSPWVYAGCLAGMPLLVALAALVPALQAHRLPAARAISAGSAGRAPRAGRALRIQRALAGTRLPRAVSLGLGQPLTRPGRTAMTLAAVLLGVVTVTLSTGLTDTMVAFGNAGRGDGGAKIATWVGRPAFGETAPTLDDGGIEQLLRSRPGVERVTARGIAELGVTGRTDPATVFFDRGDQDTSDASEIVEGHWPSGPDELAATPAFLQQRGLAVGDRITLELDSRRHTVTVVGRLMNGDARFAWSTWSTLTALTPRPVVANYLVALAPGTDTRAFTDAVRAAEPGLYPLEESAATAPTATVVGFASVFTTLLIAVAALGVFNTVLLNTRERRRDLGMLKAIGMTPSQVTLMTVVSMAALGAVAGLAGIPIGMGLHRLLVDHVGEVVFPESMKDVWHAPQLALLALAGVLIAVLGALVPARAAARLTIAEVLHNE